MSCVIPACTSCKHFKSNNDNTYKCDAFPEGIPKEYFWGIVDVEKELECNNSVKFEEIRTS